MLVHATRITCLHIRGGAILWNANWLAHMPWRVTDKVAYCAVPCTEMTPPRLIRPDCAGAGLQDILRVIAQPLDPRQTDADADADEEVEQEEQDQSGSEEEEEGGEGAVIVEGEETSSESLQEDESEDDDSEEGSSSEDDASKPAADSKARTLSVQSAQSVS